MSRASKREREAFRTAVRMTTRPPVPTDDPVAAEWIGDLAASLDDDDLAWIASADPCDFALHLDALRRIAVDPFGFTDLEWNPREAIALTRWHTVDRRADFPPARQHRRRLFSCVILLIAACRADAAPRILSSNENLITAVDSLTAAYPNWLGEFGAWCDALSEHMKHPGEEIAYIPLAAFLAEAACPTPHAGHLDAYVSATESHIARIDAEGMRSVPIARRYGRLIDLGLHDQRHALWQSHLDRASARLQLFPPCASAASWLRQNATGAPPESSGISFP